MIIELNFLYDFFGFLLCFGDIQPYVFELRLIRKENDLVFA